MSPQRGCVHKLDNVTFLWQAGHGGWVGMLPSVLWQSGLPCPWIENAVMTSGASTPAGNYRTNHVIATPQDMHRHAPLSTRDAGWRHTGSQHPASTYPSAQCSPPGVALCTCSKSKVETGRERETCYLHTHMGSRNPLCVLNSSLPKRDSCHQKIIACGKRNNNSKSTPRQAISRFTCVWES